MFTPPAAKRCWVTNLRGAAGAAAALSAPLSPLGASSARTAAVVETNRVKRMASVALRMRRISLMVSQIRLERAEVSGFRRAEPRSPVQPDAEIGGRGEAGRLGHGR